MDMKINCEVFGRKQLQPILRKLAQHFL